MPQESDTPPAEPAKPAGPARLRSEERGYRVSGGEALDGHGWGSWRSRTDAVLEALFPLE